MTEDKNPIQLFKSDLIALKTIKNDIINSLLLFNLHDAGIRFQDNKYYLHLYEIVFELIGFKNEQLNEELKDWYFKKIENICKDQRINDKMGIHEMACELVLELKKRAHE